jgi:hypothetical protein
VARKDRLVWNGDEAMEQINREMLRRLFAAAITVEKHAKVLVGKEGKGRRVKAGLNKEGQRRARVKKNKIRRREIKRAKREKLKRVRTKARRLNKIRKTYNKVARKANRFSKKHNLKPRLKLTKGTFRATKRGTLTKRKRPKPRKKP